MKNMKKMDGPDADKTELIKLEFIMDSDNLASKYSEQFIFLKDEYQEKCTVLIQWLISFFEIENLMPIKEPDDKTKMFWTLLEGQVLSYFEHHLRRRLETEDSELPGNDLIELVLRDVGLEYIPKRAIHVQKYYMRQPRGLFMGFNTSVQPFVERLNDLNRYLSYFPEEHLKQLDQDEIVEILDQAKIMDHE
jgi:hypothetical protein